MDDTEDDAAYPPIQSYFNLHSFSSLHRQKLPVRNTSQAFIGAQAYDDQEDEEEVDEEGLLEQQRRLVNRENGICEGCDVADAEDEGENHLPSANNEEEDDENVDGDDNIRHTRNYRKRRRICPVTGGRGFSPRLQFAPPPGVTTPKSCFPGARNSNADWTEQSTFILLDAWGDRFLQLGRKSLRSEEWFEVAEKVSQASKTLRTEAQCRCRLDALKKRYKNEKVRIAETGIPTSKWVYFKKMEMLMSAPSRQTGLPCGMDSGEYIFMNPKSYLDRSDVMDEMGDSPGSSDISAWDVDDDSEGLPPMEETKFGEDTDTSFKMLVESVRKFGEIYEKIENNKRIQMMELERMRMEFHRDLEVQKRQILERAQAEIAKIRQGDDVEIDISVENISR